MNNPPLYRKNNLIEKIVLVDGISRSGKSMLGPILASFADVEIERVEAVFEYIPLLGELGKLKRDAAAQLLQLEADTKLYESKIGRNTNFRITDHSGVFNNPFKWEYFKRLFRKEGAYVTEEIRKKKTIFQVQTHDVLGMIDPYFDAFDDRVCVLEMARDPIDLIYSWFKRGWGDRFNYDPLAFTFTIESEGGVAPWYDLLIQGKHNLLKPINRIILMVEALQKRNLEKYNQLAENRRKQILWVIFEDFVTTPEKWIPRIESLIGTKMTRRTIGTMKKQNCPRKLNLSLHAEKERIIRSNASPDMFINIEGMYEVYEKIKEIAGLGA